MCMTSNKLDRNGQMICVGVLAMCVRGRPMSPPVMNSLVPGSAARRLTVVFLPSSIVVSVVVTLVDLHCLCDPQHLKESSGAYFGVDGRRREIRFKHQFSGQVRRRRVYRRQISLGI